MNYKFLFIITSSIIPFKVGSFHFPEERFRDTLYTIKSIRERVPSSIIWVTESSSVKLPEEYSNELKKKSDYYVEHYDDEVLKQLYDNLDKCPEKFDFGKSLLETRSLFNTFVQIQDLDFTRAFKISGRYTLNDDFNIGDYESRILSNYYVMQVHQMENDLFNLLCGVGGQVTTGLWSFDKSLLNETIQMYQRCFSYMDTMMSYTGGIDIEHSIYKWIDHKKVIHIPSLGVNRNHGPNGEIYPI